MKPKGMFIIRKLIFTSGLLFIYMTLNTYH